MTREEIEKSYNVVNGRIRSPGKFELEAIYVPYFWNAFLNGMADSDNGKTIVFYVSKEDKEQFPELKRRRTVKLIENDSGFVSEVR